MTTLAHGDTVTIVGTVMDVGPAYLGATYDSVRLAVPGPDGQTYTLTAPLAMVATP